MEARSETNGPLLFLYAIMYCMMLCFSLTARIMPAKLWQNCEKNAIFVVETKYKA